VDNRSLPAKSYKRAEVSSGPVKFATTPRKN